MYKCNTDDKIFHHIYRKTIDYIEYSRVANITDYRKRWSQTFKINVNI